MRAPAPNSRPDAARAPLWRATPWAITATVAALVAFSLVLVFLLVLMNRSAGSYSRFYTPLLYAMSLAGGILLTVLLWVAWRLWQRLRQRKFGARLMIKLAMIFTLVSIAPGLLIYTVSYQFIGRSLDAWFDHRVEGALQSGLNLGLNTLDTLKQELQESARVSTSDWREVARNDAGLERLREQLGANSVHLWQGSRRLIASSLDARYSLMPEKPPANLAQELREKTTWLSVSGLDGNDAASSALHLWVRLPETSYDFRQETHYLHIAQNLSPDLTRNALAVQNAYREYKERSLAQTGLRNMYLGMLTLSLVLATLAAVLLSILFGTSLMSPLLLLSTGVAKIAAGEQAQNPQPLSRLHPPDDLSDLTQSFADMTERLSLAQNRAEQSLSALENARTYLQTILDTQTAGVLVLNANGILQSANAGATRVLREPIAPYIGRDLMSIPHLESFAVAIDEKFQAFIREEGEGLGEHWEHAFELQRKLGEAASEETQTILARGAMIPALQTTGMNPLDNADSHFGEGLDLAPGGLLRLVVIDDISTLISAQRAQAWNEVARRLAHEIKNPLTPIQLSAERLRMKLEDKLGSSDQAILEKSTQTIVTQVGALKRLVNEFRDYARLPRASLQSMQLNTLVQDVAQLYAYSNCPIHLELDAQCPPIMGDEQQLRQVIHNLLQNAQDAALSRFEGAQKEQIAASITPPRVTLSTELRPSSERVRLRVCDNGAGFPPHILQRVFEPYITTKSKGTGLGLAVVKKIIDEHGARIVIENITKEEINHSSTHEENSINSAPPSVQGAQVTLSFAVTLKS